MNTFYLLLKMIIFLYLKIIFLLFYGLSKKEAVILNLASFPHSKNETIEKKISYFNYKWKI